jgi:hypothetical protein
MSATFAKLNLKDRKQISPRAPRSGEPGLADP